MPIARSVAPSIELYEDPSIAEVFRHYWDAVYSKDLIAVYIAGYIALALYFLISRYLPRILANALDKPSPAHGIRVVAVFMIAVGFHFDLLAS